MLRNKGKFLSTLNARLDVKKAEAERRLASKLEKLIKESQVKQYHEVSGPLRDISVQVAAIKDARSTATLNSVRGEVLKAIAALPAIDAQSPILDWLARDIVDLDLNLDDGFQALQQQINDRCDAKQVQLEEACRKACNQVWQDYQQRVNTIRQGDQHLDIEQAATELERARYAVISQLIYYNHVVSLDGYEYCFLRDKIVEEATDLNGERVFVDGDDLKLKVICQRLTTSTDSLIKHKRDQLAILQTIHAEYTNLQNFGLAGLEQAKTTFEEQIDKLTDTVLKRDLQPLIDDAPNQTPRNLPIRLQQWVQYYRYQRQAALGDVIEIPADIQRLLGRLDDKSVSVALAHQLRVRAIPTKAAKYARTVAAVARDVGDWAYFQKQQPWPAEIDSEEKLREHLQGGWKVKLLISVAEAVRSKGLQDKVARMIAATTFEEIREPLEEAMRVVSDIDAASVEAEEHVATIARLNFCKNLLDNYAEAAGFKQKLRTAVIGKARQKLTELAAPHKEKVDGLKQTRAALEKQCTAIAEDETFADYHERMVVLKNKIVALKNRVETSSRSIASKQKEISSLKPPLCHSKVISTLQNRVTSLKDTHIPALLEKSRTYEQQALATVLTNRVKALKDMPVARDIQTDVTVYQLTEAERAALVEDLNNQQRKLFIIAIREVLGDAITDELAHAPDALVETIQQRIGEIHQAKMAQFAGSGMVVFGGVASNVSFSEKFTTGGLSNTLFGHHYDGRNQKLLPGASGTGRGVTTGRAVLEDFYVIAPHDETRKYKVQYQPGSCQTTLVGTGQDLSDEQNVEVMMDMVKTVIAAGMTKLQLTGTTLQLIAATHYIELLQGCMNKHLDDFAGHEFTVEVRNLSGEKLEDQKPEEIKRIHAIVDKVLEAQCAACGIEPGDDPVDAMYTGDFAHDPKQAGDVLHTLADTLGSHRCCQALKREEALSTKPLEDAPAPALQRSLFRLA